MSECNAGALAKALPLSAATGWAFMELRQFLAEAFHVDLIVSFHDPGRPGFSGNGEMPQVLAVCKPRDSVGDEPSVTRAINLSRNPSTPEDARAVGSGIRKAIESGAECAPGCGTVQAIEFREIDEGDWGAVHFLSPLLRKRFRQLRDCDNFRKVYLGAIADIGPTGRTVRDAFTPEPSIAADASEYRAFWGHGSDSAQTMRAKAVTAILAKPGKLVSADGCWERRSRLLLPGEPYLPSVRPMVVRLDEPTLGSMWTNCRIRMPDYEKAEYEKALCVYLNSTVGILAMLGGFTRSKELNHRRSTEKGWEMLAVPDFAHHDAALKALAAAFDDLSDLELSPLPQSVTCPVRNAIDAAVCETLGISDELVRSNGRHLVAEPSVTGESGTRQESPQLEGQQPLFDLCGLQEGAFLRVAPHR